MRFTIYYGTSAGHPNIPRVLAWGRSQYFEYIAMELLGPNIEDVVSKAGLSQRNAVAFVCQMVRPHSCLSPFRSCPRSYR